MRTTVASLAFLLAAASLTGCSSDGPKRALERSANGKIGETPEIAFRDLKNVECRVVNGEKGCLLSDRRDCRLWFTVDEQTGRITSWRYADQPEKCWTFSHSG